MSANAKFARNPSFPASKSLYLDSGWFWKMNVRQWAMAKLDIVDKVPINPTFKGETNNPDVVRIISTTRSKDPKRVTIQFYARFQGSAFVYLTDPAQKNSLAAVDDMLMQVQVLKREAPKEKDISLTRLLGKTFAINATDAKSYAMDTTKTFSTSAVNPQSVFAGVASGTNHVVISSHGGVPTEAEVNEHDKICLFIAGLRLERLRLDLSNVESAFKPLKGKMAANGVLWFGGCNIGANTAFCSKAAQAAGCYVVAPYMALTPQSFPKWHVDLIDGFARPKVWNPEGNLIHISTLCQFQEDFKFSVPV